MSEETLELEVLSLPDEDGEESGFAVLHRVQIDDQWYVTLCPEAQLETEDSALDLYVYRWTELDGDDIELDAVEDDDIIDQVLAATRMELFDDVEDEDELDSEE
ncbi:MAG: DUF1292 domain-containing protein [Myxococcota bacterium]